MTLFLFIFMIVSALSGTFTTFLSIFYSKKNADRSHLLFGVGMVSMALATLALILWGFNKIAEYEVLRNQVLYELAKSQQ